MRILYWLLIVPGAALAQDWGRYSAIPTIPAPTIAEMQITRQVIVPPLPPALGPMPITHPAYIDPSRSPQFPPPPMPGQRVKK